MSETLGATTGDAPRGGGRQPLDWQTILAIDSDKWACACYAANFPGMRVECGDIRQRLNLLSPDMADVLLGGPPCPPFSKAGKRKGKDDARNCIPEFIEAVRIIRPRQFLMEQVDGILQGDALPYFGTMLRDLESLGYSVQYRELDAVSFGVPQFRNRVWTWGIRSDVHARHCWPKPTHTWPPPDDCMFDAALLPGITVRQALRLDGMLHRKRGAGMTERAGGRRDHPTTEPAPAITSAFSLGGGGGLFIHAKETQAGEVLKVRSEAAAVGLGSCGNSEGNGKPAPVRQVRTGKVPSIPSADAILIQSHADPAQSVDVPSPTLRSGGNGHDGCCLRVIGAGSNPHFVGDVRTERDITDEPSPTIPCGDRFGNVLPEVQYRWSDAMLEKHRPADPDLPCPTVQAKWFKGGAEGLLAVTRWKRKGELWVRRLTPLECARLQSVPDDFRWPAGISKTNAYRIIGNGWASLMAWHLSRALKCADYKSETLVDLFCGGGLGAVGWYRRFWSFHSERMAVA